MLNASVSVENFLKAIYNLEQNPNEKVKTGMIAERLDTSNAATTDMAKKLARKGLINYIKYKPITLTESGNKIAVDLIRKHRLWETFLYTVFNFDLNKIHEEAENLEHATSNFLANKISDYLGNPTFDPHGDPIPDVNGNVPKTAHMISLPIAKTGNYLIARISGSDDDFFTFCKENNIIINAKIEILQHFKSLNSISIKVNDNVIVLPDTFANKIYVKEIVSN